MHHAGKDGEIMRVLVHACCGPCLIYPVESLSEEGFRVDCYYFNPNIHPHEEYLRRLEQVERYCGYTGRDLVVGAYSPEAYFRATAFHEAKPERCRLCYGVRLEETASAARRMGYGAFSTSLLVSPYQDHDSIREAGELAGVRHGVPFLYRDFRDGYYKGVEHSRELGMYRQKYCGCLFSELEGAEERRSRRRRGRGGSA